MIPRWLTDFSLTDAPFIPGLGIDLRAISDAPEWPQPGERPGDPMCPYTRIGGGAPRLDTEGSWNRPGLTPGSVGMGFSPELIASASDTSYGVRSYLEGGALQFLGGEQSASWRRLI